MGPRWKYIQLMISATMSGSTYQMQKGVGYQMKGHGTREQEQEGEMVTMLQLQLVKSQLMTQEEERQ